MAKVDLTSDELALINRALSDSLNYKPDDRRSEKLALLLRCAQEKVDMEEKCRLPEQKIVEEKGNTERCPWYETAGRILLVIGMVAFLYGFFLCMLSFVLKCFNETLGWWDWTYAAAQGNPGLAITLLVVGFAGFLFWFACLVGKHMAIATG